MPDVVNSGYGLYAHWTLTEDIPAAEWKAVARVLKALTLAYEIEVDQSRTADSSSVLRPVGAHNRKVKCVECGASIKEVGLACSIDECDGEGDIVAREVRAVIGNTEALDFETFTAALTAAATKKKISAATVAAPRANNDLNAEFIEGILEEDTRTSDALLIASKCQQIDIMRKTKGDIEEPLWYACIGLLRYTKQAPAIIHEWSQGEHGMYSKEATDAKIQQAEDSGTGPITCQFFGELNPRGCLGCPHLNKIRTPLILGRVVEAVEMEEDDVGPPERFVRSVEGLYTTVEDISICFYPHDLYVASVAYDHSIAGGSEVLRIKHTLPKKGECEFLLPSASLADGKAMSLLFSKHVTVEGAKEKKHMINYLESYAQKLKRVRDIDQLRCQMGWQDEDSDLNFVLGSERFGKDGSVTNIALATNVPESAKAFRAKGELAPWVATTRVFDQPNMEPQAFAFLAGAFGAPLMKLSGYAGAMVSMLGPSGSGKTLIGRWVLSTYGDPEALAMNSNDTKNALIGRLGVYNTLPLYIDEVTNVEGEELSDLAYRITQGKDKARLNQNAVEKENINGWSTLALVSSNSSLVEKLAHNKMDSTAEMNRIFELNIEPNPALNRRDATAIYRATTTNYGHAGRAYVRALAQGFEYHRGKLENIMDKIDARTDAMAEERYWSAIASCALYGGMVAKSLGLIDFDLAPVSAWIVEAIKDMRGVRKDSAPDCIAVLGQFLTEHAHRQVVIGSSGAFVEAPRGKVVSRSEPDVLYINRTEIKAWANRCYASHSKLNKELTEKGILKRDDVRKVLTQGTDVQTSQVHCWQIDLTHPELGIVKMRIEKEAAKKVTKIGTA
jgi:hypothetical protein